MLKRTILFFIFFSLSLNLYGAQKIYLLPEESKEAFEKIESLIGDSKRSIDIAVYNFEYKKIAKLLKKAAKRGVRVNILFDASKLKNKNSRFDYLCDEKNIECQVVKERKQHMKIILFDEKNLLLGSANLTKESFSENLELIYITDKDSSVKKIKNFFNNYFKK